MTDLIEAALEELTKAMRAAKGPVSVDDLAERLGRGNAWVRKRLRTLLQQRRIEHVKVTKPSLNQARQTTVGYQLTKKGTR